MRHPRHVSAPSEALRHELTYGWLLPTGEHVFLCSCGAELAEYGDEREARAIAEERHERCPVCEARRDDPTQGCEACSD